MQNLKQQGAVYAGFFVRLAAYLIDTVIVTSALVILRIPVWIIRLIIPNFYLTKNLIYGFSLWDIILYFLGVMYFIFITYKTGRTIGKRLLKIQVISTEGKLTLWNVIYRETIGRYLSGIIVYIGYIMIGPDREKRGLHDILCDTRVVYDDNNGTVSMINHK